MYNSKINAYSKDSLKSELSAADPHRIIQMLMQGALDRIAAAKGHIERKDMSGKSLCISKASAIIISLLNSLDHTHSPDLSNNLADLYMYMNDKLNEATITNDTKNLDEVSFLLQEIKSAWDQIKPDYGYEEGLKISVGA